MSQGDRVRSREYVDGAAFHHERLLAAMTRVMAAELLQVSERTIRNWEAGRARVPYSAFKLLQILGGYTLPGAAWQGWRLRGDALYSPEGLAFRAHEGAWWSLTCAMARSWLEAYDRKGYPRRARRQALAPARGVRAVGNPTAAVESAARGCAAPAQRRAY